MTDEDGDLSSILFALLERKVGQKGAFSHGGKVKGVSAAVTVLVCGVRRQSGEEGARGDLEALDVLTL